MKMVHSQLLMMYMVVLMILRVIMMQLQLLIVVIVLILKLDLMDRLALEEALNFKFGQKNLLITFHPVTLENRTSSMQMNELLSALEELRDTHLIFTMPNSDTDGRVLFEIVKKFVAGRPYAKAFTTLGQLRYLSCIKYVDGVVGNSSSGLSEVPIFCKGTINIGDRQRGRIKVKSVIDCKPERSSIRNALRKLYSAKFQGMLKTVKNPYDTGNASEKIVQVIEGVDTLDILKKEFYNLTVMRGKKGVQEMRK